MPLNGVTVGTGVTITPGVSVSTTYTGAVIVSTTSSPYVIAWAWSDSAGFGTKYSDPATLPTGSGQSVAINPTGTAVAVAHSISPFITVYPWSNSTGFGTKYANPAVLASTGTGVAWSASGAAIFLSGSDRLSAWAWSDATGFGTKYANPASLPGSTVSDVAVTPDGAAVLIPVPDSGNPISAWAWTDSGGFGTKYTNAVSATSLSGNADISINRTGDAVAITSTTVGSKGFGAWPWNNITGFGTRYADPAVGDQNAGYGSTFNRAGTVFVAVGANTNVPYRFITAYAWSDATGFGSVYSPPATVPTASGRSVAFSPSDQAIVMGMASTPFIEAWAWNNTTGFGTKYANPGTLASNDITGVVFSL